MDNALQPEKPKRRRGAKARAQDEKATPSHESKSLKRKIEEALKPKDSNDGGTHEKKTKRKKNQKPPKEGEPGFMTKTQMRNARKRRSKKNDQEVPETTIPTATGNSKKKSKSKRKGKNNDPSLRYIEDPKSAPLAKKAKAYFEEKKIPFEVYLSKLTGWRTVSKLPVRRATDDDNSCIIGLFKPGSHTIVKVPDCVAHHPSINKTITFLEKECDKFNIEPFNESDGKGVLRYVCLNVERSTGKVQMTLVWNAPPYKDGEESEGRDALDKFTRHLVSQADSIQLHSLWVHFNAQWKHADNIFDFGSKDGGENLWKHIHGPKYITESLSFPECPTPETVNLCFPPNVFRQANLDAFAGIISSIRKYIHSYNEQRSEMILPACVELYGGVGTIGLNLCDQFSNFVSSDENPHNKACFETACASLSAETRGKCSYVPKNATDVISEANILAKDCEVIIVDPPRKGLDQFVTQSFIDATQRIDGPKLLVYVSCGFDAFMRDCDALVNSGKWKLDKAEGHLLFPGADAIETLAFFRTTC
jgi:tRNA/tmRNA/rRNA uracil-C5-methylase (TrmA/RlmC/RlmD family)